MQHKIEIIIGMTELYRYRYIIVIQYYVYLNGGLNDM